MNKKEERYINKRKAKAFVYGLAYRLCSIFPIKHKKIVFWAFEGTRGYCCCPKYVADELLRRTSQKSDKFEMVWLVKDTTHQFPEGIKKIKDTWWNRAYHMSTAAIWVGNTRTFFGTKKRKGQTYIQTWHGTVCIKPIGRYRGDLFPKIAEIVSQADSDLIDYVISNSDWCDTHYRDGLLYDGKIIRTGMPRCDILINDNSKVVQAVRKKFDIPEDAKIMMYAPTFRGGSQGVKRTLSKQETTIDFNSLIEALEARFGGNWYILLRLHPQMAAQNANYKTDSTSDRLRDATQHLDMNELIASADGLITDYSSSVFEAILTGIPCFIYADDLDDYVRDRGDLFFDMKQLPFPLATKNSELIKNVHEFNFQKYETEIKNLISELGIVEDGAGSARIADLIEGITKGAV